MTLSKVQITEIANKVGLDYPSLMAFITVESGGAGFIDGKIVIQFEPTWFHKYLTKKGIVHTFNKGSENGKPVWVIKSGDILLTNTVEGQTGEWEAFNKAFKIDPQSALLSTSIGLMQVMGFNFAACGYGTVNAMWDDFKKGEYQQVAAASRFIQSKGALYSALKAQDWAKVAYHYNGENYKVNKYDDKLKAAYTKYSKL